jgi:YfiH family protein
VTGAEEQHGPGQAADLAQDLVYLEGLSSAGIVHAFETRRGSQRGALSLTLPFPLARVRQVHGATVHRLPSDADSWSPFLEEAPLNRPAGDAIITDTPEVTLAVAVADCLPILIADPVNGAVAAVHGGWRGLAAEIVAVTLRRMGSELGTEPSDCTVGIGPGIGPCCYQVGTEVIEAFDAVGMAGAALRPSRSSVKAERQAASGGGTVYCNLPAVAAAQARSCDVPRQQIFAHGLCTKCNSDRLWSYRAEGKAAGRMLAGIALTH